MVYPVDMELVVMTSPYGWRTDPISGERAFHTAVDWASIDRSNIPIYAIEKGTVISSGYEVTPKGHYIFIQHENGYVSRYIHLHTRYVEQGEVVEEAQVIGLMGTTGYSTGVHLDFQIATTYPVTDVYTQTLDPVVYLENAGNVDPTDPVDPVSKKKGLKIWQMIKYF